MAPVKIGIFAKSHRTEFAGQLRETLAWLQARGCQAFVEDAVVRSFELGEVAASPGEEIPYLADAIVVFGGDGTMLAVARLIKDSQTPILGVNLGSLGFLTAVTLDELYPALECLLAGQYGIDRRSMLRADVHQEGQVTTFDALNDVVINKGALARIISLDAFIGPDFIATFHADGMIVSTPTGSTAYSLSAGGPIIFPTLDSVILTPICPHTLTNRPLVVPLTSAIRLVLKLGEDVMLTVDGQTGLALLQGDEIVATRSAYEIQLIQPGHKGFFDVLREKLKWGERY